MAMQGETFIFFGIIGSGKGTQVKLLSSYLEKMGGACIYAGTGEGFRKILNSGNYTAKLINESMARGELQPDFLANSMVAEILMNSLSPEKHLLLDGYPRTVAQAKEFETMLHFFKREKVKIIHIDLSKDEAKARNLLRARTDDTEAGIEKRFEEFDQNVVPTMQYFKNKGEYEWHTINGNQPIDNVHSDILKALNI